MSQTHFQQLKAYLSSSKSLPVRLQHSETVSCNDTISFLTLFISFIFEQLCSCENECIIKIDDNTKLFRQFFIQEQYLQKCNAINNSIPKKDSLFMIANVLRKFNELQFITGDAPYTIMNSAKSLSWKNIKMLTLNDIPNYKQYTCVVDVFKDLFGIELQLIQSIKMLYWYLRKFVIDTLLSYLLDENKVVGISVGSTNITSDYDITLYSSNFEDIAKVISEFSDTFTQVFGRKSNIVFDTNVYGVSYIYANQIPDVSVNFSQSVKCGNQKFQFVRKIDDSILVSQHIWAFAKLNVKLEHIQEQHAALYDIIKKKFDSIALASCRKINIPFVNDKTIKAFHLLHKQADKFVNAIESDSNNYESSIRLLNDLKVDNQVSNVDFNNYISYVNYNGLETYYTRGAFLDVVVNTQMCKTPKPSCMDRTDNNTPVSFTPSNDSPSVTTPSKITIINNKAVVLDVHDYLDSFIENMGELIEHYTRTKYLDRAINALNSMYCMLSNEQQKNVLLQVLKELKTLMNTINVCSNEIIMCSYFLMVDLIIEYIIIVSLAVMGDMTFDTLQKGVNEFNMFMKKLIKKGGVSKLDFTKRKRAKTFLN